MALQTSRLDGRRSRRIRQSAFGAVLMALLFAVSFTLFTVQSEQSLAGGDQLKIWFFDIGQGDAILIDTPDHQQILIDGGPDATILNKLGGALWPTDRTIDALVLTHPDADHVRGLTYVLERYDIAAVYETGARRDTQVDRRFVSLVDEEQAAHRLVKAGQSIVFGDVVLHVLAPASIANAGDNLNNASVVLLLEYGDTSVLLTGDMEAEEELSILDAVGDVDVLKVAHHGSSTSSVGAFLDAITPEEAVISVGKDNSYGHPNEYVLERLLRRGMHVYRTDEEGDILLQSTGGEPVLTASPLPF